MSFAFILSQFAFFKSTLARHMFFESLSLIELQNEDFPVEVARHICL